jgi:O-antigen ligase
MCIAYLISRRLFAQAVEPRFVERLFGVGYTCTAIMFLAQNMWVFLSGLALVSVFAVRRFTYPLALFVFLLLLMPGYSARVPGFGLVNWLIDLNPWRVLALTVLLPSSIYLVNQRQLPKAGSLLTDKLVIAFVLHVSILNYFHQATFTGGLRQLVMGVLDILLLYFVASRGLMLKRAFRHVMVALVMASIFLALVGSFEFLKHWLLYSAAKNSLGATSGLFNYLGRGDVLRASATTGQPIVLGFIMMVAFLMSIYAQKFVQPGINRKILWLLMGAGLVAAMSRGPWVGTVIGLGAMALFSSNPAGNLVKLSTAGLCAAVVLMMLPGGEKIVDYLPWVGTVDAVNITFREILWEQTLLVIEKHFWIGSIGYQDSPEFDLVRSGNGFVDIVNSYLGIVLAHGVVGLALYACYLFLVLFRCMAVTIKIKTEFSERQAYSLALLSTLIAMVITTATVSSIGQIAPMLTLFFAAGVANANLYRGGL